jgi:hypothetical protein
MNMIAVGGVFGLMKSPYDQIVKVIGQLKSEYKACAP